MKRIKALLLSLLLIASVAVPAVQASAAAPGTQIGYVLNTDIRVFIDGTQIMGYNIDGVTYVVAEDLIAYGFAVYWNAANRSLSIARGASTAYPRPVPGNLAAVGSIAFPYVATDIVTYIDGRQAPSFNIQGSTVVRIDDLAAAFGYAVWNPDVRELRVSLGDTPVTPPAPQPTPTPTPPPARVSITRADYDRISVASGQAVNVTIVTSAAVNYVWISLYDGSSVNAVFQSQDYYGDKTWSASFYPSRSGQVRVLANATNNVQNAAVKAQQITVTTASAQITRLETNRTSIEAGQSVVFTIQTSSVVNNVWLEFDGTSANAAYVRTAGADIVWEATIYPSQTGRVYVYANVDRTYTGAAEKNQTITVAKESIRIYNVTANPPTITAGSYSTLTIETSFGVEKVYAEYDGRTTNATFSYSSGNRDVWTINVNPGTSQYVGVSAYSRNNQYAAASQNVYITVGPGVTLPVVHSISANRYSINQGEYVTLSIETTRGVNTVVVQYDNALEYAVLSQQLAERDVYTINIRPMMTQQVNVQATNQYGTGTSQIYITVAGAPTPTPAPAQRPTIYNVSTIIPPIITIGATEVHFEVVTSANTDAVTIVSEDTTQASLARIEGGRAYFTAIIYIYRSQRVHVYASNVYGEATEILYIELN